MKIKCYFFCLVVLLVSFTTAAGQIVSKSTDDQTSHQVSDGDPPTSKRNRILHISSAIDIALKNNPDLKITGARVAQAEERLKERLSTLYPTLTLKGGYERIEETAGGGLGQFITSDISISTGQIETRYLISIGGGRRASIRQTREEVRAATLEQKQVQALLAHQVRTAYYNLLLARESTRIAKESLVFAKLQKEQAQARLDAGVGLKTDVLTFSVRVSENMIKVQEQQNKARLAFTALAELLGVDIPEDVVLAFPESLIDYKRNLSKNTLVQQAFNNRPELIALERYVSAALEGVKVEKSAIWPRVEIFANYGFTKYSNLKLTSDDDEARIGINISFDIFDGGAKRSRVKQSIQKVDELKAELNKAKLKISRLVEDVLNNISEAKSRLNASQETILLAEENLELRTTRYEAGVGTILEVTEGEVQLLQARLTELQAKIDLLTAQSKFKEVLGEVD